MGWLPVTTERIADHLKFAYWVPNVSGGLVTSDIEQRTDWGYDFNVKLAQTAENNGFEYALSHCSYCVKFGRTTTLLNSAATSIASTTSR